MESRVWHSRYDDGVPVDIDYEELALPAFLERSAERNGAGDAVRFLNCRLTYSELKTHVDRCANGLSALGVKPGTRVAIHMPNLPQTVIAYYAALGLGAELVMTNPLYTGRELEHQWCDAGVELVLTMDFLYDQRIAAIRSKLPVKTFVLAKVPEFLKFPLNLLAPLKLKKQDPPAIANVSMGSGMHSFKDLVKRSGTDRPRPDIDLDSLAVLQYTGGTTGVSKGAMLSHRNLSYNIQQVNAWFTGVEYGREVLLSCLPLFHVFGMTVGMNWGIYSAASLILMPNPRDFKALVGNISKHRVTLFPGVPALFNGLNNYPGIESVDVSSVKSCFSGSAPIPVDVLERFETLTGSRILEGFGMSETSPVTHVNPLCGERRIGSVGFPVSDTDARVVSIDDGDVEVPIGTEGELVVRGPQVMSGYWNQPEETAKTLINGWLHTGDLAIMDEEGYFKIVGRKKDMINAGGFKIFPDEVDGVLMAHEGVLESATIGIPDPKRGETVKSFIVKQPASTLTVEEVDAYCRENLAAYKVPREVEFLDELPKSSVLKVLRRELRDRELAKREKS